MSLFLCNAGRQLKSGKPVPIAPVRINKTDQKNFFFFIYVACLLGSHTLLKLLNKFE